MLTSTVGSGRTESPDAPAPVVLRGRLVRPTAVAVHSVAAGTADACASFKNRTAIPARPFTWPLGVGLSGGDDKDPGHVVGAVAVLGPGFGETGVLEGAATVCQPQQMVELGRRRGRGHTSAAPLGEEPVGQTADTRLATTGHAISGANRRASAAMEPARRGCVSTRRRADAMRARVVVADDDARAGTEELDGVRECGGDDWPAARDGVDQNTGGDLIGGVVGQNDHGARLDEGSQR